MPSREIIIPVEVASAATDVQGTSEPTTLYGFAYDAAAATTVYLRDGTTATDTIVAAVTTAGAEAGVVLLPAGGVQCYDGVFVDRDGTNAAAVTLFTETD